MHCNAVPLYSAQCNASDQHTYLDFGETAALAVFLFASIMLQCMSLLMALSGHSSRAGVCRLLE